MQIKTDEKGFITDYALIGTIENGIETDAPLDLEHFEANFQAYRIRDGAVVYDDQQKTKIEEKALCDQLRQRRETECFSYINRGQLWYDRLTEAQKQELSAWYTAWLAITETLTVPERPSWLY